MKTLFTILTVINVLWGLTFIGSTKVEKSEPWAFWHQRWYEKGYWSTLVDLLMMSIDSFFLFILVAYLFLTHL